MSKKTEVQTEQIRKVAERIMRGGEEWAMNIESWDWVPGVGMYALLRAAETLEDEEMMGFVRGWVERHGRRGHPVKTVNSTAPLLTVLGLWQRSGEPYYLELCREYADWLLHEAPRTRENGLEHTVTEAVPGFREQIWADTLFMACIFLARLGRLLDEPDYTAEAAEQLRIHHALLRDRESGLYYHGWNCASGDWMSAARWGRANAWIAMSTTEMLEELPDRFPGRDEIVRSLQQHVEALRRCQRDNGMFGTLLNRPDSYDETSATAGIAYGVLRAVSGGWVDLSARELADKAAEAVLERIGMDGEVQGVSTGTPVMPTEDAYKTVPVCPTLYGQGMTLLLLCER